MNVAMPVVTRRSLIIAAGAIASAAAATGLAAAATQPAGCPVDPIHRAIAAHAAAARHTDLESAKLAAAGDPEVSDWGALRYAALAEIDAGRAVVETRPTTLAGLNALGQHLRDGRYQRASLSIVRRVDCGDGFAVIRGGPEAIDWLVAQRAAMLT
jgi:hypothetical protein